MLKFIVQGSIQGGYEITAQKSGTKVMLTCTCEAGIRGTLCKHRLAILGGDVTSLLSDNAGDLARFHEMLSGTGAERSYHSLCKLEKEKEKLDALIKAEKKAIAREISGATT
jgi:hypothetical protein